MAHFDNENINKRIDEIDALTLKDDFYSNQRLAKKIIDEKNDLVEKKETFHTLVKQIDDLKTFSATLNIKDLE